MNIRTRILGCAAIIFLFIAPAKAQLVLNNGIIVNVNGGSSNTSSSTIVLNNPPASATSPPIKQVGTTTSQGIMLESEWNRVQYNLKALTYSITIPYISNTTGAWVPFPLTMRNVTAGTGANGAVRFSSRHAAAVATGWDNTAYEPSKVLNMNGAACAGNNSGNAIDRFWVIEPVFYTVNPAVILDFTYIMSETDVNGGNTASLALSLQPQRYDTTVAAACAWNGFPSNASEMGTNTPAGSITATSVGTMNNVSVTSANFFPDWTLASYLTPLPVEVTQFTGECSNENVVLHWTSMQETNADHYTIESSGDAQTYSFVADIPAAGNSNQNISYIYTRLSPPEQGSYYRLSETDKNGTKKYFNAIWMDGCKHSNTETGNIYSYGADVNIDLLSPTDQDLEITAYDVTGRLIYENSVFVAQGKNHLTLGTELSQGVYLFHLKAGQVAIAKRILIQR